MSRLLLWLQKLSVLTGLRRRMDSRAAAGRGLRMENWFDPGLIVKCDLYFVIQDDGLVMMRWREMCCTCTKITHSNFPFELHLFRHQILQIHTKPVTVNNYCERLNIGLLHSTLLNETWYHSPSVFNLQATFSLRNKQGRVRPVRNSTLTTWKHELHILLKWGGRQYNWNSVSVLFAWI